MAIITLLTDFGVQDEYVGVLKGVILGIDATANIVDISHGIAAQDVVAAAHTLKAAYHHFPGRTVHAAIVDPGVGTERGIIAAKADDGHRFIAPDNGLLEPVLTASASLAIHRVENETLFRHPVSRTFHGRDIIAPVAAHLSAGRPLADVGPEVGMEDIHCLEDGGVNRVSPNVIEGRIISIDHFGNLITNIMARYLADTDPNQITFVMGDVTISGLCATYAQGRPGAPVAVVGSRDTIEIAVKEGSAARLLNLTRGTVVRAIMDRKSPEKERRQ